MPKTSRGSSQANQQLRSGINILAHAKRKIGRE